MEKTIYDESNGLWYELRGDYYIPYLTVPAQETKPIGIWGQRHLRYIKKYRIALYTELLISGRLNAYLSDINEHATEQMLLLIQQMAEREGVTEQLKEQDQMLWVQRMNNFRDRAMEFVNHDLIYAGSPKFFRVSQSFLGSDFRVWPNKRPSFLGSGFRVCR